MPHKYPIERRELKKQGFLKEDDFFKLLAANCNYIDEETVRNFYSSVIKTITKELREKGFCRLPYLGDFALVPQKAKILLAGKNQYGMQLRQVKAIRCLKFYPKEAWKQYFVLKDSEIPNKIPNNGI